MLPSSTPSIPGAPSPPAPPSEGQLTRMEDDDDDDDNLFRRYGRCVAQPKVWALLTICILATHLGLILGGQIWALPLVTDVNQLWIDPNSQLARNNKLVDQYLPPTSLTYNELFTIQPAKGHRSMQNNTAVTYYLEKLLDFSQRVQNITVTTSEGGMTFTYFDLCAGRLNQNPYAWGCNVNTVLDSFQEGSFGVPHEGAAQFYLNDNLTRTASDEVRWALKADLSNTTETKFFLDAFLRDCADTGLLYCERPTFFLASRPTSVVRKLLLASEGSVYPTVNATAACAASHVISMNASECASVWDKITQEYVDVDDGLANSTTLFWNAEVITSAAWIARNMSLESTAAADVNATGKAARMRAWRQILKTNPLVDTSAFGFVNRHAARPSFLVDPLFTLSRPNPDLLTQSLRPLIMGGTSPALPAVHGGRCSCRPGFSGANCQLRYDPICTCRGSSLVTECTTALFNGCLRWNYCSPLDAISDMLNLGKFFAPTIDFKAYYGISFYQNLALGTAMTIVPERNLVKTRILKECFNYAMCLPARGTSPEEVARGVQQSFDLAKLDDRLYTAANSSSYSFARRGELFTRAALATFDALLVNNSLSRDEAAADAVSIASFARRSSSSSSPIENATLPAWVLTSSNLTDCVREIRNSSGACDAAIFSIPFNSSTTSTGICPFTRTHLGGSLQATPSTITTIRQYFECYAEYFANSSSPLWSIASVNASFATSACADGNVTAPPADLVSFVLSQSICLTVLDAFYYTFFDESNNTLTEKNNMIVPRGSDRLLYELQLTNNLVTRGPAFARIMQGVSVSSEASQAKMDANCEVQAAEQVPVTILYPDCLALYDNFHGSVLGDNVSIAANTAAFAKYGFIGTLNGACTQPPTSPIRGGGDCYLDSDCLNGGNCTDLENANLLTNISAFATAFFTADPSTIALRLNTSESLQYRDVVAYENLPGGLPAPIYVTEAQISEGLYAFRRRLEEIAREINELGGAFATSLAYDAPEVTIASLSDAQVPLLIGGYVLMIVYAVVTLSNCDSTFISSRGLVGAVGVLLVSISVASGLSISVLGGIKVSASATQVLPFLMLGLGVDYMFVTVRNFPVYADEIAALEAERDKLSPQEYERKLKRAQDPVVAAGVGLKISGASTVLMSITNASIFAIANLTRMPVVANMASEAAIIVTINFATVMLILPGILALDYRRQVANRMELCCCVVSKHRPGSNSLRAQSTFQAYRMIVVDSYAAFLTSNTGIFLAFSLALAFLIAGAYSVANLTVLGLPFSDVASPGSDLQNALVVRDDFFPFYGFTVITTEADYSLREVQQGLKVLFDRVMASDKVVDGSAVPFILPFMVWGVPEIPQYSQFAPGQACDAASPTTRGNCGYKFNCTVVTGHPSVTDEGNIPFYAQEDFYRCLERWINEDLVNDVLQPDLVLEDPEAPKGARRLYFSSPNKIPFARVDVIAEGLSENSDFVQLINDVRAVANERSTPPAFAVGTPFDFWDQYIGLYDLVNSSIGYAILLCFFASTCLLLLIVGVGEGGGGGDASGKKAASSPESAEFMVHKVGLWNSMLYSVWGGICISVVLAMALYEIFGFMNYASIKMSAIPAVSLIMGAAPVIDAMAPTTLIFCSSIGTRRERVRIAMHTMMLPVSDGIISTFLGILFISASPFAFVVKYVFLPYILTITFVIINGLIVLPMVLAIAGPPSFFILKRKLGGGSSTNNGGATPGVDDKSEKPRPDEQQEKFGGTVTVT